MAALRSAAGTQMLLQHAVTHCESAADVTTGSGSVNEHMVASSTEAACCKAATAADSAAVRKTGHSADHLSGRSCSIKPYAVRSRVPGSCR